MAVMKIAQKLVYEYEYWFTIQFMDKYGIAAERLYKEMSEWLENSLDLTDYSVSNQTLIRVHYTRRYQIDFRTEAVYSFFALCWDSRVDDYLISYKIKRKI